MKILAIIPARGGSKGVPRKNIKLLGGKPLMAYTIESALQSSLLNRIIVSTEDEEIASVAATLGLQPPFMRPAELAEDSTPTIAVLKDIITRLAAEGETYDAVMILQPTCPFRESGEIDDCIRIFSESDADALISVRKVPDHYNPHWVFEPRGDNTLKIATGETTIIPRRQELPEAFVRDGSVYITKTQIILEKNSLFGERLAYRLNTSEHHINIDTQQDWLAAEQLIK